MSSDRTHPRPATAMHHLIALFLCLRLHANAESVITDTLKKFDLTDIINYANAVDCKEPPIRFEEPCRCYRLHDVNLTVLDCDRVAFRFFPPVPFNVKLHLASFRNVGYQGLPTELFADRRSELQSLDLSQNNLLSLTADSLNGLETSLRFLNLSRNNLGSSFQPQLEIPELQKLAALEVLDLSRNHIKLLSENIFGRMQALKKVCLNGNDLSSLEFLTTGGLSALEVVDLSENRIFRLEPNSFHGTKGLREIDLRDNFIGLIRASAFAGTRLQKILLSANRIQSLEPSVFSGTAEILQELDLSFNMFQDFPNVTSLAKLKELNISYNQIKTLDAARFPRSLEVLDLTGNGLIHIDVEQLASLQSLRSLIISRNFLSTADINYPLPLASLKELRMEASNLNGFPTKLLAFASSLRALSMGNNNLNELPDGSFGNLSSLVSLRLNSCKLKTLPSDLNSVVNLRNLDISRNLLDHHVYFRSLPETIESLDLAGNRLTFLKDLGSAALNLLYLDVSENLLREIDLTKDIPATLKYLNASGNLIQIFPVLSDTWEKQRDIDGDVRLMPSSKDVSPFGKLSLEVMDFSGNAIRNLDQIIRGMQRLKSLCLQGNQIETVSSFFLNDMPLLEKVDLSDNTLTVLNNKTFLRLPALQWISLRRNKLKIFNGNALESLPSVRFLDLSQNGIKGMHPRTPFIRFRHLETLDLTGSDFTEIQPDWFSGTGIVHLRLRSCNIRNVSSSSFVGMSDLQNLYLDGNEIKDIQPNLFATTPQLQHLDLSHNLISSLSDSAFRDIRRLSVDISYNYLEGLVTGTFSKERIDRLESINLESNRLVRFPGKALYDQEFSLIELDLSENRIVDVPSGSLINVKHVSLASNPLSMDSARNILSDPKLTFSLNLAGLRLTEIPSIQLQFLSSLNLSHNRLTTCGDPVNWDRAVLLQSLDLSYNWITDLTEAKLTYLFPKLGFLKFLNLAGNPIKNIRESELSGLVNLDTLFIADLPRLETFDVSNFVQLPRLQNLHAFGYPKLQNFPVEDVSYQPLSLAELRIELKKEVLLDDLDGFFGSKLRKVYVTGTRLKKITDNAFHLLTSPKLEVVLDNVPLETLSALVFRRIPRSTDLHVVINGTRMSESDIAGLIQGVELDNVGFTITNNQVNCDCRGNMRSVWRNEKKKLTLLACDTPAHLAGKNVLDVDKIMANCEGEATANQSIASRDGAMVPKSLPERTTPAQSKTTEPEVIFEVTTAIPVPVFGSYHLEGMIAGTIVGLLFLTMGLITGIICWNRREMRRQNKYVMALEPSSGIAKETQYAVGTNPDIVAHPTWFPPPQPVFVVPLRPGSPVISMDPRHTEYYVPDSSVYSAPSIDYSLDPSCDSDYAYTAPSQENEDHSRVTYSQVESTFAAEPYSEDYFPDDESIVHNSGDSRHRHEHW